MYIVEYVQRRGQAVGMQYVFQSSHMYILAFSLEHVLTRFTLAIRVRLKFRLVFVVCIRTQQSCGRKQIGGTIKLHQIIANRLVFRLNKLCGLSFGEY